MLKQKDSQKNWNNQLLLIQLRVRIKFTIEFLDYAAEIYP